MRAVKTVISAAGNIKREYPDMNEVSGVCVVDKLCVKRFVSVQHAHTHTHTHTHPKQEQIVLRAIRDTNVPKFLQEDLKLFNGIVSDLFPTTEDMVVDYGDMEKSIRAKAVEKGLEDVEGEEVQGWRCEGVWCEDVVHVQEWRCEGSGVRMWKCKGGGVRGLV